MATDFDDVSSQAELVPSNTIVQNVPTNEDEIALSQAAIFIEDAFKYRSIHHKIDPKSLKLYHIYYSKLFQWSLSLVIFINLSLAFVEQPSSLSWSSDPRDGYKNDRIIIPCGITESIELACMIFFLLDLSLKTLLFGKKHFYQSKWLWGYVFFLVLSFIDWLVTINLGCDERYRIRRLVRPFFLLQRSSLMKKTVRAISRTLPQIFSVFFLLFLHLLIFTILGMLLLTQPGDKMSPKHHNTTINVTIKHAGIASGAMHKDNKYFENGFGDSLMRLLVLLTTANNPDVMIPAYKNNRLYAIYFIVFTFIGLYCFMNLLLAVVYSQFQGYLKNSLQSSYFRLRTGVRAAFEILRQQSLNDSFEAHSSYINSSTVSAFITRRLVQKVNFRKKNINVIWDILDRNTSGQLTAKQFQELFDAISREDRKMRPPLSHCVNRYLRVLQKLIVHPYFNYFGLVVVAINAVLISVELSRHYITAHSESIEDAPVAAVNFFFVVYYFLEQSLKLWAAGWQRYICHKENIFDGVITGLLAIVQIIDIAMHGSPLETNFHKRYTDFTYHATWNILKVINILIVLRLTRTISSIQSLSVITKTLVYLLRNLKPFAGVIVAVYYVFAIFGMMIFENAIEPNTSGNNSVNLTCGTYEQLEYWANNFDDFAASLVMLWDAMVVNNWHIFLHAYTRYTTSWSQLFFVAWYLISVVICVNLFVALLLDVFIDRWQENQQDSEQSDRQSVSRSLTQLHQGASVAELNSVSVARSELGRKGLTEKSFMVDRKSFRVHEMFGGALNEPLEEDVLRELVYHGLTFKSNFTPSQRTSRSSSSNYSL